MLQLAQPCQLKGIRELATLAFSIEADISARSIPNLAGMPRARCGGFTPGQIDARINELSGKNYHIAICRPPPGWTRGEDGVLALDAVCRDWLRCCCSLTGQPECAEYACATR
jgi:hypothetical protein